MKNHLKKNELKAIARALDEHQTFLILVHKCPDPDAAGAAIALATHLKQKHKKVIIGVKGDSFSKSTRLLLKKTGFSITSKPTYNKECIIVVDTNSPALFSLDEVLASGAKKIIIDHHHPKPEVINAFDHSLIDEEAVSTTQIIFHLLDFMDAQFTHTASLALAAGILTDSANFVAATVDSFVVLGEVLARGKVDFKEVLASISVPMEKSEKIARMKAAQRLKFYKKGDYLITSTKVNSFEGGVAKAMLYLGADVSFVGATHSSEMRISARAKNDVIKKGLHLGRDVLPLVVDLIGGDAGGHAGAAGANGTRPEALDEALRLCVERTKELLRD
ncbi:DHH family phosphoesterase [archaeon]|nr:DHH family phosphoesterase [archaeon]